MQRKLTPEILDYLPADHPAAMASRRDIGKFNVFQGNFRWMANQLRPILLKYPRARVVELGAGRGELAQYLLQQGILSRSSRYTALDLATAPENWPAPWHWYSGDLFNSDLIDQCEVCIANLVLHHFDTQQLISLGERLSANSRLKYIRFNEPSRSRQSLMLLPLARLFFIHPITVFDSRVSVEGGFSRSELSDLLNLGESWTTTTKKTPLGAYRLMGSRKGN